MRVAEADRDAESLANLQVTGHLLALVPSDGPQQFFREVRHSVHERGVEDVSVTCGQVQQSHEAGLSLDQSLDDGPLLFPYDQVPFLTLLGGRFRVGVVRRSPSGSGYGCVVSLSPGRLTGNGCLLLGDDSTTD